MNFIAYETVQTKQIYTMTTLKRIFDIKLSMKSEVEMNKTEHGWMAESQSDKSSPFLIVHSMYKSKQLYMLKGI